MKDYYRIMLGRKSMHASEAFEGGFIGAGYGITEDLSQKLPDQWRDFNKAFIPVYLAKHPKKNKISAGLAMGMLWTVSKGIKVGDIVLSPDGEGAYRVAEVTGGYMYSPGEGLAHRRPVRWLDRKINRTDMSEGLRNSCGSIGTVSQISKHADEIEQLLKGLKDPTIISTDPSIEDPTAFAMEKHLEDFLVKNWGCTELSREYNIYEEDGDLVGQQFPTDTGPIDILAVSKDNKTLLVH